MKKKSVIALAMLFTLSMSMTAFAAPSTSATTTKEVTSQVNTDGTTTAVVQSATGTKVTVVASTAASTASVKAADGTAVTVPTSAKIATGTDAVLAFADKTGKKIENVTVAITPASNAVIESVLNGTAIGTAIDASKVAAAVEINVAGFTGGTATLPLSVASIKKGEAVYGVHFLGNGSVEYIPAVASANGIVTITTTSFSPIVIVKGTMPATATATTATTTASATDATTSPKTGDMVVYVIMMAAACLAGAAYCTKKLAYNK